MTDRELLELAAKAAGYLETATMQDGRGFIALVVMDEDGDWTGQPWNPLTDDGDALRLAVKLMMEIRVYKNCVCVESSDGDLTEEKIITDHYAATRRAIVRAAAEIGRMK